MQLYNDVARHKTLEPDVCTTTLAPEAKYEEVVYESLDEEEFVRDLRRLQHKNKFTNKTCLDFISLFSQYVDGGKVPAGFTECDKKLKEAAGVKVIELHGCKSNCHVYGPEDERTHCPCCGAERYDADTGKPTEVCMFQRLFIYFALF